MAGGVRYGEAHEEDIFLHLGLSINGGKCHFLVIRLVSETIALW